MGHCVQAFDGGRGGLCVTLTSGAFSLLLYMAGSIRRIATDVRQGCFVTEKRNVLVFPGGTEIGLEVRNALANRKEVALFSAGAGGSSHAPFAFRVHDVVPDVSDPAWFDELVRVVRLRSIDYVFATHEDVLLELARRRDDLPAALIASPTKTLEIARSKTLTYEALGDVVRVPRVFDPADSSLAFPVFVKPDRGAGSRAAIPISTVEQLARRAGDRRRDARPGVPSRRRTHR